MSLSFISLGSVAFQKDPCLPSAWFARFEMKLKVKLKEERELTGIPAVCNVLSFSDRTVQK